MRRPPFEFLRGGNCQQSKEGHSHGWTEGPWPWANLAQWDPWSRVLTLAPPRDTVGGQTAICCIHPLKLESRESPAPPSPLADAGAWGQRGTRRAAGCGRGNAKL